MDYRDFNIFLSPLFIGRVNSRAAASNNIKYFSSLLL